MCRGSALMALMAEFGRPVKFGEARHCICHPAPLPAHSLDFPRQGHSRSRAPQLPAMEINSWASYAARHRSGLQAMLRH